MVNENAVIYIYTKNALHSHGFVLEIVRSASQQELYKEIADDFVKKMLCDYNKDVFNLFWQSGCHDKYNGYNYFESWTKLTDLKQDMMLNLVIDFAKKWNILCSIGRPEDFPV